MEFIDEIARDSKLEFKDVSLYPNDSHLWRYMYNECLNANTQIDKSRFTVHKLRKKIANILSLVRIFNKMIINVDLPAKNVCTLQQTECNTVQNTGKHENVSQDSLNCPNCEIFCNYIENLEEQIDSKTNLLEKLQKDSRLTQIAVITTDDKKTESKCKQQSSYIPESSDMENVDATDEKEMKHKNLLCRTAKLKLQIHDQLMKVLKDFPIYDTEATVFSNWDLFEMFADRFNLSNDQRNYIFQLWVPVNFAKRINTPVIDDEGQEKQNDATDRLRQLLLCMTGEQIPTIEMLDLLQTTAEENPIDFKITFCKVYQMIFGVDDDNDPGLKTAFIKKFKYLDPTSVAIAQERQNLNDIVSFIDKIRRQLNQGNLTHEIAIIQCDKNSQAADMSETTGLGRNDKDSCRQVRQGDSITCLYCHRSGHMRKHCCKFKRDSQIKTKDMENEKSAFVKPVFSCQDNILTELPYAAEVKQISNLTVNSSSDNTVTEREGLLPLPKIESHRDSISLPLQYVAPIILDENGRPYIQCLLNGKNINCLIDSGSEISLTKENIPVKPNSPMCNIVGFNNTGNSTARQVSNVTFEVPGLVKTNINIWVCHKAENILGIDVINEQKWVIDLANKSIWKDPSRPKSVLIDPSVYSKVGSVTNMSTEQKWPDVDGNCALKEVVQRFPSLWSKFKNDIGTLKNTELNIEGKDPEPLNQYELPLESIGPLSAIIQEFVQLGIVKKAKSVVNNCIWPMKNTDNSYSLSVDLRTLNKHITNNPVLPDKSNLKLNLNAEDKVFSVLKIMNSHFSLSLANSSQYKFAFTFRKETYTFTRLIPGLGIGDGIVHESIAKILSKFSRPDCICQHVDTILLSTQNIDEHIALLSELFMMLQAEGLKLNTTKVQLMKSQVKYLHMQISQGKRQLLQETVREITAIPTPTTHKALRQFLHKINHCKEFVHCFTEKVNPLYNLLRNKGNIVDQWGPNEKNAFEMLKKDLQNAPALSTIEVCSEASFVLKTHVSENAISVTLSQLQEGKEKIIAYFSRVLSFLEKTFESGVKQLLSVYYAIKATERIVKSNKIIVQTPDCSIKGIFEEDSFKECRKTYPLWFRALSSKHIQIDVKGRHLQECTPAHVYTAEKSSSQVSSIRTEKDIEPVLVTTEQSNTRIRASTQNTVTHISNLLEMRTKA